ncbi:MAG: nucleoside triphosphate pyrophosphohydrolase [Acidimicrobiia bacterium]|nr:nucleoside triphosphate pyrophosphohydrolase [Acidimicrobiia bacterium]
MKGERFLDLVALVDRLRGPGGCPWDREQTLETLKPMMLEEAYEVLDAMDSADRQEFCSELGDLLFQVVFLSRVAEDEGWFQVDDVAKKIVAKMVRRHPHVFGTVNAATAGEVVENWENIKRSERAEKQEGNGSSNPPPSILEGIAPMPALLTASKLTSKAARVGFDWPNVEEIFAKLHEEVDELKEALLEAPAASESSRIEQEVGDLLFVAVNIARFLQIDPETALRKTNRKFISRFQHIEHRLREAGKDFSQSSLEEMERFWQEAKREG